ncbi:2'-5' RNA ligase family protein [Haloglycomyces albus]|uniref:2'-5' RNA ligase family protein n=1 Tax=Haloglycomyces albus TaxID=526067 RepID=UPI0004A415DF|nr:2'-5' RNA ligase family protein [Haloglycomyces albus]
MTEPHDMTGAAGETVNVGVSVPVPEPWLGQLDQARIDSGDPQGGIVPAHLTLLPPSLIQLDVLPEFERHLTEVAARLPPFLLHLRGTGTFRPITDVVFVAVAQGIAMCERLAAAIGHGPIRNTYRYPYHPHVTVAQDVPQENLDRVFHDLGHFDAQWTVDGFVLYTHSVEFNPLGTPTPWTPKTSFRLTGPEID